jgi:hypothetical protein
MKTIATQTYRTLLIGLSLVFTMSSCSTTSKENAAEKGMDEASTEVVRTKPLTKAEIDSLYRSYGAVITPEGAADLDTVMPAMQGAEKANLKLVGTVHSVCQVRGCWMKLALPDGQLMHVTFKDHGFFVPPNLTGKQAILEGTVERDTVDIETLRHLAEDAGKDPEEIASIVKPEFTYLMEATGVLAEKGSNAVVIDSVGSEKGTLANGK